RVEERCAFVQLHREERSARIGIAADVQDLDQVRVSEPGQDRKFVAGEKSRLTRGGAIEKLQCDCPRGDTVRGDEDPTRRTAGDLLPKLVATRDCQSASPS